MIRLATIGTMMCLLAACGGDAELGEACDTVGSLDECVDPGICTNESDGAAVCRKICTVQTDCATGEDCNGVSGSNIKSCQPKK